MRKGNKVLAKVSSAGLSFLEREILTFWIHVEYEEGLSQGIGGIALDTWDESKCSRVGTAYGCELIRRMLREFKVNDLTEMSGIPIWVYGEGEGFQFKPTGVSSLSVNNRNSIPIIFDEVLKEFMNE